MKTQGPLPFNHIETGQDMSLQHTVSALLDGVRVDISCDDKAMGIKILMQLMAYRDNYGTDIDTEGV